MAKKGSGISMRIGSGGYSLGSVRSSSYSGGSSGYSLAGSGGGYSLIGVSKGYSLTSASKGYSLTGSGKGYSLTNRINDSSRIGYSFIIPRGYANAGMKMKGYSIRQSLYGPVSLFPVRYSRVKETLENEMFRKYKKKCPSCGKEPIGFGSYSLN
mgnify:CR=1 FL=1